LQIRKDRTVHREDPLEPSKVIAADLARTQRPQIVAAPLGVRYSAVVRRVADVPITGAGGVDLDTMREAGARRGVAKYDLRRRRTADVAETYEEDTRAVGTGKYRLHSSQRLYVRVTGAPCMSIGIARKLKAAQPTS
jgi:hypothetical protein